MATVLATVPETRTVAAVVAPLPTDTGYATALSRQGALAIAVTPAPPAGAHPAPRPADGPYTATVLHTGDPQRTATRLRSLGVQAVVAGSAAGIALAEDLTHRLRLPGADPHTSLLRRDRGVQAHALAAAGIPAAAFLRTARLDEAVACAHELRLPSYELAPAAADTPTAPVVCRGREDIHAAWAHLRHSAFVHCGDPHLVLALHVPGPHFLVNTLTRTDPATGPRHTVTDVWRETRTPDGRPDRTELMPRDHTLARVLSLRVLRTLDVLGITQGPATTRLAYSRRTGPVHLACLAVAHSTPADEALHAATGRHRFLDALDTVIRPRPALQPALVPTGHHIVRVHRHPTPEADDRLLRTLPHLPTVVRVTDHARTEGAGTGEIVLSGPAPLVEADYHAIRTQEAP
ncbi:hypothetical protein BJP40_23595 [Streptomyces sp. CC53]|uniref:hypothetical protein n=1 Tax=unclassified Streptomyces TaxID=2593676 RepID=UPI0008DCAAAD|nr:MULTISPECIES: hypothetical protein [unclassified Streptomyces]OII63586.1 hypothetical protein BJP40_23595 [Streptomyces sp. CC53]